ncbi:MAG: efflux transporter outer membrane subunit [Pseudomonadota bacterium]|nr:efflux transporter outer membrane subunit [Pseudomonadota bacterium]
MKTPWSVLALALLLGACALPGPGRLPADSVANSAAASAPFVESGRPEFDAADPPGPWWRLYRDTQLDALVEQALAANTEVRVAIANLAQSEAMVAEVNGARELRIGASATAVRAQESAEAYLLPEKLPVENLADAGIRVAWQADLAGALKRASEAAAADAEVSRSLLRAARMTIAAEVARQYVENCAASAELNVAEQQLALQQRQATAIARQVAGGRRAAPDIPRSHAAAEEIRATLPGLSARRRIARYRLAVLTGHPPAESPLAAGACTAPPSLEQALPVGDGAGLLRRRPDIRQAEFMLAGATARLGIAQAALYPTVTLGLGVGATGLLEHFGQPQTQRWSLGPLISWTLPGTAERARVRAADAASVAALAHYDGVVLHALEEVESAMANLGRDLDRDAALRKAREEQGQSAQAIQKLYQGGRLTVLDDIDAQRALSNADMALAVSAEQIASDQVRLFLTLGGGWQ